MRRDREEFAHQLPNRDEVQLRAAVRERAEYLGCSPDEAGWHHGLVLCAVSETKSTDPGYLSRATGLQETVVTEVLNQGWQIGLWPSVRFQSYREMNGRIEFWSQWRRLIGPKLQPSEKDRGAENTADVHEKPKKVFTNENVVERLTYNDRAKIKRKYAPGQFPCGNCRESRHKICRPRLDERACTCTCEQAQELRENVNIQRSSSIAFNNPLLTVHEATRVMYGKSRRLKRHEFLNHEERTTQYCADCGHKLHNGKCYGCRNGRVEE